MKIEKAMSMQVKLIFCVAVIFISISGSTLSEEIPDFEFDDNFPTQKDARTSLEITDFDDFFIDDAYDTELDIVSKENVLKDAIVRALSTKELKYKFSEVLPLLRHLSKAQRMVFSAIISAQINGGRSFTLDEVY